MVEDINLEEFRRNCINELVKDAPNLKKFCDIVLDASCEIYIIGSVLNKHRFTEQSDIDIGVFIKDEVIESGVENGVSEDLSMELQRELLEYPFSFGVVNCVVFCNERPKNGMKII